MQDIIIFINHHPLLSAATALVFMLLVVVELIRSKRNVFNITPAQVTQLINRQNAAVIDIRQQEAYQRSHIIDAASMDPGEIQKNPKKLDKFRTRPIIIVGHNGHESQKIAALLLKQGYNAYALNGGMRAWTEAQMPLVGE